MTDRHDVAPFTVLITDPSSLTDWGWGRRDESGRRSAVVFVRGRKMRTLPGLYDELAAALQFPWYFGENLDALEECLNDLEWIDADELLLIVRDADAVLQEEPNALDLLGTVLGMLEEMQSAWAGREKGSGSGAAAEVVLHAAPPSSATLFARLDRLGVRYVES